MSDKLRTVFTRLVDSYETDGWWPADSTWEVMVGALLVQRTNWRNAALALARLDESIGLSLERIATAHRDALEASIRPSGFYRQKAERLQSLATWVIDSGGTEALALRGTGELRSDLLALPGIGPETADAILLYGFERAVFVVDAYARRLFQRTGVVVRDGGSLGVFVQRRLALGASEYQAFHAAIVEHGKLRCRPDPRCAGCVLVECCDFAAAQFGARR